MGEAVQYHVRGGSCDAVIYNEKYIFWSLSLVLAQSSRHPGNFLSNKSYKGVL